MSRKTPRKKPNRGEGTVSTKPRLKNIYDFLGLVYCFVVFYDVSVVSSGLFIHLLIRTRQQKKHYTHNIHTIKKYIKNTRSIKLRHVHTYQQNRAKTVVSLDWQIVWEVQSVSINHIYPIRQQHCLSNSLQEYAGSNYRHATFSAKK